MSRTHAGWLRLYRLALRVLPPRFRVDHAAELEHLVADRMRDAAPGVARWHRASSEISDVVRVGATLRAAAWREERASRRHERLTVLREPGIGLFTWRGLPMRTALRSLLRRPGYAALATLVLALGVGGATAIFAAVDAVLLRPLPHPASERLVMVWRLLPSIGWDRGPVSYPDYIDLRDRVSSLSHLAAFTNAGATLHGEGDVERLFGATVTGNLFRTLGDAPALGRTIVDADDRRGAENVIVISDGLWRRRFGADSSIVGRAILLDGLPHTVTGVMPPDFVFPTQSAQFWTALRMDPATAERDANFLTLIGRLGDGVTMGAAQAQVLEVAERIVRENPGENTGAGMRLERRHDFVIHAVRPVLVLLAAAAAVLLVIALANLTNLQLVRGVGRRREQAVRRALGASFGRQVREHAAEIAWIAAASAVLGVMLSTWLTAVFLRHGPAMPRASQIDIDARAVLFALAVTLVCAAVAMMIELVAERRQRSAGVLSVGTRSGTERGAHRAQELLVIGQLALALTLFVGAGLLGRSFSELTSVPRGFRGEQVLTARMSLPRSRYAPERVQGFYHELLQRVERLPGVEVASGTWALPFGSLWASSTMVPADRPAMDAPPQVTMNPVRPRFFETIGMTLREGRDFTPADGAEAPQVAIVNETLARQLWPGQSAVGRQLRPQDSDDGEEPITVVGVVADIRRRGLAVPLEPEMYVPHAQASGWTRGDLYIAARTTGDPHLLVPALRRIVAELDPMIPLADVATLDHLVNASIVPQRFRSLLVSGFAAFAGLLALVGIYGVLVFAVGQRRHELAVRSALGATPRRLLSDTLVRGCRLGVAGAVLGLAGAAAATPLLRSLLFQVDPFDVATYALGMTLLAAIAVLGSWLPARRAAHADPMITLREG